MGGGSSKQGSLASPPSGANGRGTNNRRPSSIYTVPEEEDSDDDCLNCSFLGGFCPTKKKKTYDPMGTPVPDTPVVSRKQRKMFENAIDDDNGSNNNTNNGVSPSSRTGLFSSRYFGLEKEEDSSSILDTEEEEEPHDENAPAQIHEGPGGEAKLRAKYEVCEVIGVGSTSTVHRCVDRKTGADFACKIIDKKHMEQRFQGMVDQFHTEIQALQSLRHAHIIALYDVYITDEKIYIVMERMEGGELFDYVVQRGTLNEEEASRIVRQVTSALVYVHSMNFLHRDLKPENLLLRQKPLNPKDIEVKIIDFGLSKFMEEPVASSFLGTRGYLAPEMLQRKKYTSAVDAWALGVIVFVLLCGCLPFDDDSQSIPSDALMRSKFILRFPRWARDLSPSAKDLLSHLLDVNSMTRYTTEQALQHPWVSGKEAPRNSLLQSPGRIKQSQSPYLLNNGSATRTAVKDHVSTMHATRSRDAAAAAAGPKRPVRQHVRKTSI